MTGNLFFGIEITKETKSTILEKIKKNIMHPVDFFHIVSLNPENLVVAQEVSQFREVIRKAQIRLIDGIGIILAGKILGIEMGQRVTGVELVGELFKIAQRLRLRVLLIGSQANLADSLAKCYQQIYPEAKFIGLEGIKNIKKPTLEEEKKIFSIVADFKPHILLVAFGSPEQELWLYRNRARLRAIVCMGVGGAFDYLAGLVPRPPRVISRLGFEWFYRLIRQPWRWRRQLRLIKFVALIFLSFWSNFFKSKIKIIKILKRKTPKF